MPGWPRRLSRSTITLSCGPDPTGLGQPTTLQGAAGQLSQRIRLALGAAPGIGGVGRAGQRFQGGQQGLAGLRPQQPIDGDHALEGRGQPQPAAGMAALPFAVGAIGVGHLEQMPEEPPQPTWVQLPGRLDQHWFGLGGHMVGQVLGAGGQHLGVSDRQLTIDEGLGGGWEGAAEQGPGGPDMAAGRPIAQVEPVPQPGRGRADLLALFGPGGPAGVDPGQFLEPVAFQAVDQLPQHQDPLGPDPVAEPVQVLAGQLVGDRSQRGQVLRCRPWRWGRMCVRVHGGNLSTPQPKATTRRRLWTTSCH